MLFPQIPAGPSEKPWARQAQEGGRGTGFVQGAAKRIPCPAPGLNPQGLQGGEEKALFPLPCTVVQLDSKDNPMKSADGTESCRAKAGTLGQSCFSRVKATVLLFPTPAPQPEKSAPLYSPARGHWGISSKALCLGLGPRASCCLGAIWLNRSHCLGWGQGWRPWGGTQGPKHLNPTSCSRGYGLTRRAFLSSLWGDASRRLSSISSQGTPTKYAHSARNENKSASLDPQTSCLLLCSQFRFAIALGGKCLAPQLWPCFCLTQSYHKISPCIYPYPSPHHLPLPPTSVTRPFPVVASKPRLDNVFAMSFGLCPAGWPYVPYT